MRPFVRVVVADWEYSEALNNAASMRREASRAQDRARFLCVDCRGPDGRHASSCALPSSPSSDPMET